VRRAVRDNGTGISPENLKKVFAPFFTTKPVGKGTGLGLSVCYGIIDRLGGEMEVASEKGVGTTFTIRLPAIKA
jgi:two-component system NtrC family sensor kinase